MRKKKIFPIIFPFTCFAFPILLAGCDPEGSRVGEREFGPLSIASACLSGVHTRSTTLNSGNIGIYRLANDLYAGTKYNAKYAYNTTSGKWEAATTGDVVYLTKNTARLCAYYPYNSDADYADGEVTLTSQEYAGSADLCYQTGVTANSGTPATFILEHAYARISFSLTRGSSYPEGGACAVSNISIANSGIVNTGSLDMITDNYTQGATGTPVSYAPTENSASPATLATLGILPGGSATTSALIVPATMAMSGNITLSFTVDGKEMTTTLDAAASGLTLLAANTNYSIPVTINGTGLAVGMVTTTDWTEVPAGTVNTVTLAEEANCYMLRLGESVYIPVSRAETAWTEINGSTYVLPSAWTASLLWTDNSHGVNANGSVETISYNRDGGYIKVTAGAAEGNAVIAAYDIDGTTILWSWHIWVTNYNPNTPSNGTTYNFCSNNPLTFMDRNLGATTTTEAAPTAMGLLYQWGRKDPFPGASAYTGIADGTYDSQPIYNASGTQLTEGSSTGGTGINSLAVSVNNNLPNSILNPMTFYYGTSVNNYDWYSVTASTHNNTFWGNPDYTGTPAAKTIFDPCPAGWRVPTWTSSYSPWDVFGSSTPNEPVGISNVGSWRNYGLAVTSVNAGYFPGTGARLAGSGAFSGVGDSGNYWSASPYDDQGFRLSFNNSNVYPAYYNYRANGQAVRCVRDE